MKTKKATARWYFKRFFSKRENYATPFETALAMGNHVMAAKLMEYTNLEFCDRFLRVENEKHDGVKNLIGQGGDADGVRGKRGYGLLSVWKRLYLEKLDEDEDGWGIVRVEVLGYYDRHYKRKDEDEDDDDYENLKEIGMMPHDALQTSSLYSRLQHERWFRVGGAS